MTELSSAADPATADRAQARHDSNPPRRRALVRAFLAALDRGHVPDRLIRSGIRRMVRERLRSLSLDDPEGCQDRLSAWVEQLRGSPVAIEADAANAQHYEVPAEFYRTVLGPHLKYSCALWRSGTDRLADAEAAMLELYAERAELVDGMDILDLGCGWGSLSLWLAERYPGSRVVGLSNSASQRAFIMERAGEAGLGNLEIVTRDVNDLPTDRSFDRVLSIEMFEHVRNYERLMGRIAELLRPGGKLFVHVFAHRLAAYPFEDRGDDDWMARHFFTGGQMPAANLLHYFQRDLTLERSWQLSGVHYQKTAEAWLQRFDAARSDLESVLTGAYGSDARRMAVYWRVFFMSCAEMFGFDRGREWVIAHDRFVKPSGDRIRA